MIGYGLRNKREVWKAASHLRRFRRAARDLLALMSTGKDQSLFDAKQNDLIGHLQRMGLLGPDAGIDDVLSLKVENQLERRLQTIVYRKGLARSPKQARQLITHGHIAVGGKCINIPGYLVARTEESEIGYYTRSPVANPDHAERIRITRAGR